MPPAEFTLNITEEAQGRVLVVELDHGRANEMGSAQLDEWAALTKRLAGNDVRAVITFSQRLSRKGTPIFIAGANVTERADWDDDKVRAHVRRQRSILAELRKAPVFHICVVDGVALGWGTEFLIATDYRIAGPRASFSLPETGIGILPGAGGTSELPLLIGVNQSLRLGMTGERVDAAEATRIGLVDEAADSLEAGLARARALAEQIARRSPTAVATYKQALLAGLGCSVDKRMEIEARAYEHCLDAGDASIGRENFKAITAGAQVPWGPRSPFSLP